MWKGLLSVLVLVSCAIPAISSAEDWLPPPWRGEWSTTSQYWEFSCPLTGMEDLDGDGNPEDGLTPDGSPVGGDPYLPSTRLWVYPEAGTEWIAVDEPVQWGDRLIGEGVWPLSGYMDVIVDNHDPHPENIKLIWVQVTWRPNAADQDLEFYWFDPMPVACPVVIDELLYQPDNPLGWRTTVYFWQLDWNPPDEMFRFGGEIHVDELVVDTWCVPIPEPGLLAIAGCGLLLLRRRAK
ncbi:MAG: hypothetical protein JW889_12180 [Verrucomicrobia bacterium]|nr:hypothetical protein [Verrucomicrobiota bacterium]